MSVVIAALQHLCVIVVAAYLLARVDFFREAAEGRRLPPWKLIAAAAVFSLISVYGQLMNLMNDSATVIDTGVVGVALAALLFGYGPALPVLLVAAIAAIWGGAVTVIADITGLLLAYGLCGYCMKRFPRYDAVLCGVITGVLEICHMLLIVALVSPMEAAKALVYQISFSMIVLNGCAVVLFVLIVQDMRNKKLLWQKEQFSRSELSIARNIQLSLLQRDFCLDPRLDLHAYLEPAYDVGGDLYGFTLSQGRWLQFLLGDVSGKGVPAAITMSRAMTLFRVCTYRLCQPRDILNQLNHFLCQDNAAQMFVTVVAGRLDLATGQLIYANAGHTQGYLVMAGQQARPLPKPKGMPLGVMPGYDYSDAEYQLPEGGFAFFYTDGVSEAEDGDRQLFGAQRLAAALSQLNGPLSAESVNEGMLAAVSGYCAGAPRSDDIAMLALGLRQGPKLSYERPATLEAAAGLSGEIFAALSELDISPELRQDMTMAAEELITNIIKYGYGDGRQGAFSIELWPDESLPLLIVRDDSDPFDPFSQAPAPALDIPAEQRLPGGMGVHMVKKRLRSYDYSSQKGINTLTLLLKAREARHEQ